MMVAYRISAAPWTVRPDHVNPRYHRIYRPDGSDVARVYRSGDAKLIEQAPKLFEALKRYAEGGGLERGEAELLTAGMVLDV